MRLAWLIAGCFAATVRSAAAQAADAAGPPHVDLSVNQVVTGGHWQTTEAAGRYRIIAYSEGWEEVRYRVVVEWIQETGRDKPDSIRQSIDLNDRAGVYGLADPALVARGSKWVLSVESASRPLGPYDKPLAFALGAPGTVSPIRVP